MSEVLFFIKKFISFFCEPLGVVTLLFFAGFYFLKGNKSKKAGFFFGAAFLVLMLFSYMPFASFLIAPLEKQYKKLDSKIAVEYLHVLGNSHTTDAMQPLSSQLSAASVKRVSEGVVLYTKGVAKKIVFTGYKGKTDKSTAQMNADFAKALGVKESDLVVNPKPKDTKEEALFMKSIVKEQPFVLVTSASHMPRAMKLFKSLGMHPIAAPTDFHKDDRATLLQLPTPKALAISTMALHEYLGMLWAALLEQFLH